MADHENTNPAVSGALAAVALAELINGVEPTDDDEGPGAPAVRVMADPANAELVDTWYACLRDIETSGPTPPAPEEEDGGGRAKTAPQGKPDGPAPASLGLCPTCFGHLINRLVVPDHDCPAPFARQLVELIDREWIASCLAREQHDPGLPTLRALASPMNAHLVDGWYTETRGAAQERVRDVLETLARARRSGKLDETLDDALTLYRVVVP